MRLAASGQPLRTIHDLVGHADSETTRVYARWEPSEHEVQLVNAALAELRPASPGSPSEDAVR